MYRFRLFVLAFLTAISPLLIHPVYAGDVPKRFHLRKNPHIKVKPKVSEPIKPKKSGITLTKQARLDFCLHVRGWAMPTSHFFELMEKTLSKGDWGQPEKELVRDWLDRGFGYAIGHLIESSNSRRMLNFKKIVKNEYPNTSVVCPLACSYREYVTLLKDLPASEHGYLKEVCAPNCRLKTPIYTAYDRGFCECLVDSTHHICQVLDHDDLQAIQKAQTGQASHMREYENKTKRRLLDGESSEAIENRKEDIMKQITSALSLIRTY